MSYFLPTLTCDTAYFALKERLVQNICVIILNMKLMV